MKIKLSIFKRYDEYMQKKNLEIFFLRRTINILKMCKFDKSSIIYYYYYLIVSLEYEKTIFFSNTIEII